MCIVTMNRGVTCGALPYDAHQAGFIDTVDEKTVTPQGAGRRPLEDRLESDGDRPDARVDQLGLNNANRRRTIASPADDLARRASDASPPSIRIADLGVPKSPT